MRLEANDALLGGHAGDRPRIELVTDLGGRSPVEAFEDGRARLRADRRLRRAWIAYDATLGPQLREVASLSTDYYGFDTTTRAVRRRRASARRSRAAVDWRRIGRLAAGRPGGRRHLDGPAGHPRPVRARLPAGPRPRRGPGAAGRGRLPGRRGLPRGHHPERRRAATTTRSSPSSSASSGIDVEAETMDFGALLRAARHGSARDLVPVVGRRLPGPQRLPGRPARHRLRSTTTAAGARRSSTRRSPRPAPATDPAAARRRLRPGRGHRPRDVPVVPISYGTGWALSRDGPARRRPERPRASCAWRAWHGPTDPARRAARRRGPLVPRCSCTVAVGAVRAADPVVRRRRPPRRPFGEGIAFTQPVDARCDPVPGRAAGRRR